MTLFVNILFPALFFLGASFGLSDARLSSSGQVQARDLQEDASSLDCSVENCDDGNSLTIDTCDPNVGCQHLCDDGNACTHEMIIDGTCQYVDQNDEPYDCTNDDGSDCIPGLIDCSDNNPFTTDICVPSSGCRHIGFFEYVENLVGLDSLLDDLEAEETIFYEEQSNLNQDQVMAILDWIKLEVTQLRTPFCWRRSYGRGVGEPIAHCPPGKERVGLFCLTPCPQGFSRQGTVDCHQNCKDGWRDDGLFCRKPEYGRGLGYPWLLGDPLFSDVKMFERCENDHGSGNCELHGLIVYPKCRFGYSPFGCCICRPDFESCEAEGYADFRIDLSCAAKIEWGDPTPLKCRDGLEQDGLLCYPPCQNGYNGVGPVCWQECDSDQTWCAAGCARTTADCIFAATDQIITPIIAAANIATLGANAVPSAAAGTAIEIANQLYQFATVAGEVMGWLASVLEVTNAAEEAPRNAKVVSFNNDIDTTTGNVVLDGAISATLFGAQAIMGRQFAQDFVSQTSPQIAQALATNLDPRDVLLIQRTWADVQFWELASTEGWNFVDLVLSSFGVLDPTGIVDLLAAYVKPICLEIFPFPVCSATSCQESSMSGFSTLTNPDKGTYELSCEDVEIFASRASNCEAIVDPISLDRSSFLDPNHQKIFLTMDPAGPFPVQDTPQSVTLIAKKDVMDHHDHDDSSSSCTATITIRDETPTFIACPLGKSQSTDPGTCGATVTYEAPTVMEKCNQSSGSATTTAIHQSAGLSSGSVFQVGSTTNTFDIMDQNVGEGGEDGSCSFVISVFDTEPPQLLFCEELGVTISTNPGECIATYDYQPPIARDNCDDEDTTVVVLTASPTLDGRTFPLGSSIVEYTATDLEGNQATCSFVVNVLDEEKPTASCIPVVVDDDNDGGNDGGASNNGHDSGNKKKSVFTILGNDNCHHSDEEEDNHILKAYVIDSVSGIRFPTAASGLDYYPIGTMLEFLQFRPPVGDSGASSFPREELLLLNNNKKGNRWRLFLNGQPNVVIEDASGNKSDWVPCLL